MTTDNKDHLEDFIKENREAFDMEEPSNKVWNKVDASLNKSRNYTSWMWKAASLVFFLTSAYLFVENSDLTLKNEQMAQTQIDEEFAATEEFYIELISEKRDQIFNYINSDLEVEGMYEVDVQQLDAMYQVLKEQYAKNPSKELQEAMVLNLLVRIDVLNQQLSEIEGAKKKKKEEKKEDVGV